MTILLKVTYKFNATLIKIPMTFFAQIHIEFQGNQNSQNKLEKEQTHTSQFQNLLQNHNYQNSVLLT